MSDAARLAAEIEAYATTVDNLRAIASRADPARRNDLVALRRQLAERIAQLRSIGLQVFADPAQAADFRTRLSDMQNGMALHQATWPAIIIDQDDDAYRRSAQQLADANRAFIGWTRAALAAMR